MPARIRRGDVVAVISGDDRGKRGRVLRTLPDQQRVIVEGVSLVYKHLRRSQKNPQGGRIRREAPIHVSNVMPIDPDANEPTRVTFRLEKGRHVRVAKRSGSLLDVPMGTGRAAKAAKKKEAAKASESES